MGRGAAEGRPVLGNRTSLPSLAEDQRDQIFLETSVPAWTILVKVSRWRERYSFKKEEDL